jgi:hypothetical protein
VVHYQSKLTQNWTKKVQQATKESGLVADRHIMEGRTYGLSNLNLLVVLRKIILDTAEFLDRLSALHP